MYTNKGVQYRKPQGTVFAKATFFIQHLKAPNMRHRHQKRQARKYTYNIRGFPAFRSILSTTIIIMGNINGHEMCTLRFCTIYVRNTLSCCKYSVISNRHVHRSACRLSMKCPSLCPKVKVKQSLYRPGQTLKFPESWGSQILRQPAHKGGKVVSRLYPQRNIPGTGCFDPRATAGWKD